MLVETLGQKKSISYWAVNHSCHSVLKFVVIPKVAATYVTLQPRQRTKSINYSYTHIKLNGGVNDMTPVISVK